MDLFIICSFLTIFFLVSPLPHSLFLFVLMNFCYTQSDIAIMSLPEALIMRSQWVVLMSPKIYKVGEEAAAASYHSSHGKPSAYPRLLKLDCWTQKLMPSLSDAKERRYTRTPIIIIIILLDDIDFAFMIIILRILLRETLCGRSLP